MLRSGTAARAWTCGQNSLRCTRNITFCRIDAESDGLFEFSMCCMHFVCGFHFVIIHSKRVFHALNCYFASIIVNLLSNYLVIIEDISHDHSKNKVCAFTIVEIQRNTIDSWIYIVYTNSIWTLFLNFICHSFSKVMLRLKVCATDYGQRTPVSFRNIIKINIPTNNSLQAIGGCSHSCTYTPQSDDSTKIILVPKANLFRSLHSVICVLCIWGTWDSTKTTDFTKSTVAISAYHVPALKGMYIFSNRQHRETQTFKVNTHKMCPHNIPLPLSPGFTFPSSATPFKYIRTTNNAHQYLQHLRTYFHDEYYELGLHKGDLVVNVLRCDCPSSLCSMLYIVCYTITNTPRPPSLKASTHKRVRRQNVDNAPILRERCMHIYKNKWTKDDDFSFIFSLRFSRSGVSLYDCI